MTQRPLDTLTIALSFWRWQDYRQIGLCGMQLDGKFPGSFANVTSYGTTAAVIGGALEEASKRHRVDRDDPAGLITANICIRLKGFWRRRVPEDMSLRPGAPPSQWVFYAKEMEEIDVPETYTERKIRETAEAAKRARDETAAKTRRLFEDVSREAEDLWSKAFGGGSSSAQTRSSEGFSRTRSASPRTASLLTPHLDALGLAEMPRDMAALKAAYRARMKVVHPDAGAESHEQAAAANAAFAALKPHVPLTEVSGGSL